MKVRACLSVMDSQSYKTWQTVNSKLKAAHFKFSGPFNRNADKPTVLGYFYLENKVVERVVRRLYQQQHQVINNFDFVHEEQKLIKTF